MLQRNITPVASKILSLFPVLGIVGPRQVGKTVLSKQLVHPLNKPFLYLDLESPNDLEKLANPESYLLQHTDYLIVLDEVQRKPDLFPVLRSVIDRDRKPGRFMLLGSASPDLIRDSSESLAGRIAYLELSTLNLMETGGADKIDDLWINGGYPEIFFRPQIKNLWYQNYIRTYLERDLPMMGFPANPVIARRLWYMLAHYHGQLINYTEISKSLEITIPTVKGYINFLEQAFLIRQLEPYIFNIKKRLVKSSKLYIRDSGMFHHLQGIDNFNELFANPKMGASWEGFVIEQIYQLKPDGVELYFYRTHQGAEIDLVLEKNGVAVAVAEIKYGDKIIPNRGNTEAANSLNVEKRFVITKQSDEWETANGFVVTSLMQFLKKHLGEL